jgi:hypothetical protein
MSCKTCPYAKPLGFAVYCKRDWDLRDLPASIGYMAGDPIIQTKAPDWCPLLMPNPTTQHAPEYL